jgi:hypothetical protein
MLDPARSADAGLFAEADDEQRVTVTTGSRPPLHLLGTVNVAQAR